MEKTLQSEEKHKDTWVGVSLFYFVSFLAAMGFNHKSSANSAIKQNEAHCENASQEDEKTAKQDSVNLSK